MKEEIRSERYTDEDLVEFKELIETKLGEAKDNLELLIEAYTNNGNGTEDTAPSFKVLEEGNSVRSKEENAQMAARQQKFIKNLENALLRIENKTYGVCRETGTLISKERLRSVPHATLSIEAKNTQNRRR
ncbi:MAG: TraR/DksA family transcriptional regulator [Bacteroidales bacterium]|nr:TraR/DksA family transcriptional regulator [Bacteroidales bacterium]